MKISRLTFAVIVSLGLVLPGGFAAQQSSSPTPPVVALSTPTVAKKQKPQLDRYKGRVLAFNLAQLIVQSTDNERMVWTFQYSADLRPHVIDLLSSGGYQYGDKVQVYCNQGTKIAVKVKGKPSKSS